ncbi:class I SAM-dependent methyltransferase [Mycolicibacterium fallax]|uniref:SAM-dependent methyltransferase n=1 Tax=Mycolicibacterium fallax TaxID=1793 RepID=A0A1X1RDV3_MYCFA|nr:methyltransferase domain-containing protein [Mycolicibacterium fallax]ORV03619.1 SAM-dependent methyltransferase [Mycolicibacterium fallax]BBY99410.1 similarity with UbiE/COQ5 methyltransferase [Mycolicibacterium fallax]HSA41484.1 methyltransferase domain-containing protein [Mycobacterium sp.]
MSSVQRRVFNDVVTGFWSLAAPVYNLPILQGWVYRPAQTEVIAALRAQGSRRIADIACGTGILADRIQRELDPEEIYGVDMAAGMLAQARARSAAVTWLSGPAEALPFDDGALDAVVTTSAFHFFDQPAALADFYRVLAPGGVAAVTTFAPAGPVSRLTGGTSPAHAPTPAQMRALFTDAGFTVIDQHRVPRPAWIQPVADMITVGRKA